MTKKDALLNRIRELQDTMTPEEIAGVVGVSVGRVEALLDELAGYEIPEKRMVLIPMPNTEEIEKKKREKAAATARVASERKKPTSSVQKPAKPHRRPGDTRPRERSSQGEWDGPVQHGTISGYKKHQRYGDRGEEICIPCREAKARDSQEKRDQEKKRRPVGLRKDYNPAVCGTPSGYNRHLKDHEKPCDPCRLAKNAAKVESERKRKEQERNAS